MKILIQWNTALGSRVVVAEGGDPETARAIAEAHRALGLSATVLDEQGRFDIRAHFRKLAALKARNKLRVITRDPKVTQLKRRNP